MSAGVSACLREFDARHIFYKSHSAVAWPNGDGEKRWQLLQREGFAGGCLSGGGRFYFAYLLSNVLSSDLGVCAPAHCSEHEVTWELVPAMYGNLFNAPILQYGLRLREYRALGLLQVWEAARETGAAPSLLCAALLGCLGAAAASAGAPGGAGARAAARSAAGRSCAPLCLVLLTSLVLGEVTLHTRWNAYRWHEKNSALFAAGRFCAHAAEAALPAAQMLLWAGAAPHRRLPFGPILRLARLVFHGLLWTAAARALQPVLTVNLFSKDPWLRPTWIDTMVECVNAPAREALLPGGMASLWNSTGRTGAACPHLEPVRRDIRCAFVALPLLVASSILGAVPAGALAAACALAAGAAPIGAPPALVAQGLLAGAAVLAASVQRRSRRAARLGAATLAASLVAAVACLPRAAPPAQAAAAVAPGAFIVLLAAVLRPATTAPPPALISLEAAAEAAIPAVPFLLFVVEGYAEPHAKWLTSYDFFQRALGVLVLSLSAGAAAATAWRGAEVLITSALALARSWPRLAVRLSVEGRHAKPLCACRCSLPSALLAALLAALLGAGCAAVALGDAAAPAAGSAWAAEALAQVCALPAEALARAASAVVPGDGPAAPAAAG